jgi:hypothetical protein
MYEVVDRSQTQFWPHDRYHPRYTQRVMRWDGASILVGLMRDDGKLPEGAVRLPDVPFRIVVPATTDYRAVNLEVWARLEAGERSLSLDFTPIQPQAFSKNSSVGLLSLVAVGLLGFVLFASN